MFKNIAGSVFFIFLVLGSQSQAATVSFNNSVTNANIGDSFMLTVQGSGFDTIVGGGLNLSFNASVLQLNSVTINQTVFDFYIGDGTEEGIVDNSLGLLLNTSFNTFFGASGNFDIMDIGFTAIGAGSSNLTLSESLLWVFADEFGAPYGSNVTYNPATVNVVGASPVPVPAAVWLFLSGIAGLLSFTKKK